MSRSRDSREGRWLRSRLGPPTLLFLLLHPPPCQGWLRHGLRLLAKPLHIRRAVVYVGLPKPLSRPLLSPSPRGKEERTVFSPAKRHSFGREISCNGFDESIYLPSFNRSMGTCGVHERSGISPPAGARRDHRS
ncbi:hypothetical protein LZ30DRAFT_18433 [Colletotrichum cereale]|nr:hypothetical protein LZ30DRAFT_18433 [Colletotrichum cereale]